MDKHAAAHVLGQIASYLELKGENPFKVRAFLNAAHAVEGFGGELADAVESGEFASVKGIGPATLEVIRDLCRTGNSAMLESLRREVPAGLVEMLRISGLGVAKIRTLHERLGVSTVAELEAAAGDGRIAALPRFGEKTARNILKGIEFLRRTSELRLWHHAERQAASLRAGLERMPGIERVAVAGSVRRRLEVIRDVDLVVAGTAPPAEIGGRLRQIPAVREIIGVGDAAFTLRLADGTAADVFCGPPAHFGLLLVWATGSGAHLNLLEGRAASLGLTLSRDALLRDAVPLPMPEEEALYAALDLPWIPPELREGGREIERATRGPLPRLLERADLLGFLHCHSTYSDGANTVAELAEACRAAGYRYMGLTDHSVAAAYAGGLTEEVVARQHAEIDEYNRGRPDFQVLKGIEADILADGRLDYSPQFLDRFDFVIGSVHSRFNLDEEKMTQRVLRAMDDPHLAILGHPTGRLLLSRDPYAIDMHRVIARAALRGVAIEINADPQRCDLDWRLCAEAREAGVAISIGADAHSVAGLHNIEVGVGIARKGWLRAEDILNTREAEGFLDHVRARRR